MRCTLEIRRLLAKIINYNDTHLADVSAETYGIISKLNHFFKQNRDFDAISCKRSGKNFDFAINENPLNRHETKSSFAHFTDEHLTENQ